MKKVGEIDYDLKLPKNKLYLCRPNKETIAIINEAYDIQYNTKLNTINELSFKIPIVIIKDDVIMENPNVERIKHRFLFKFVVNKKVEYFLFNEQNKIYGNDEYIEYHAYSLGAQLSDKNIRELTFIGDLKYVGDSILDSIYGELSKVPIKRWEIGYVDSYFRESNSDKSLSVREFTITSVSALEAVYQLAEVWNAIIIWDTVDLKINFYRPENVGLNRGFYIRDGKYLESFDLGTVSTDVVTRLRAFGSDGLDFREISPIGEDYIEDYSYYMYPFEYDKVNKKVKQSSYLMSDELCISIITYQEYLLSQENRYNEIIERIRLTDEILNQETQKLNKIKTERVLIQDELDRLLAQFQKDKNSWGTNGFNDQGNKMGTPEHHDILTRLSAKRLQESNQEAAVKNAEFSVQDANMSKLKYLEDVSPTNFFSIKVWEEFQNFIVTKEYTNDAITNVEDLMEEAKTVFAQYKEPKVALSMSIVDFLSVVECQNDWDKLNLGDTIKLKYDRMKVNVSAKIIEINYNFQDHKIDLTISNEKELKDAEEALIDALNMADITSTIVQLDKNKWNLGKEANGKVNDIINNYWDALKQSVLAGQNQLIEISERGIIIKSPDDPMSWLVIQNGFLAITNSGGADWKHAISKDGIFGEYIFGKLISGVNLYIEDESGAWKTQGSRTTIYNNAGDEVMWLGLISPNSRDKFDNILRGEEGECFGLLSWNSHTRVELSECLGFAISKWDNKYSEDGNFGWEKTMWVDTNGTLHVRDLVAQSLKIVNDIGETILDAENNYFNLGLFNTIVADGKLTTLEKLQIAKELYAIHSDYKELLTHAEKFIRSNRDNTVDFSQAWDEVNGFTVKKSDIDLYIITPLVDAYTRLINYISDYISVVSKGISTSESLHIDMGTELMESTSEIADRGVFVQRFKDYHDESLRLKKEIENAIFYSGISMGEYYNNIMIDKHGFVAVRNDGKYRAYLNATNGLALEKWEDGKWVKKLYASLGSDEYEDGTLIAEDLVAKRLRIETKFNEVLLDMDSLNIDFGVLNSIVYDDIIASIEKETLKAQWESIVAQYTQLDYELDKYINEVYDDRENSYYALDLARTSMVTAKNNIKVQFDALKEVLNVVFMDMTKHTHIEADLNMNRVQFVDLFNKLYAAFEMARNSLKDFLEKSSLQLGRDYNNTVIDAENGVTVYRGDMMNMTRLNATDGISISRNDGTYNNPIWNKVFYVGLDGNLFAHDVTTHNLKIVDADLGERITFDHEDGISIYGKDADIFLNANDAIRIKTKSGEDRFWVDTTGDLFARRLYIIGDEEEIIEDIDGSYISDLTVNSLKTLGFEDTRQDIIHIAQNFFRFNTVYDETEGAEEITKLEFTYEESGTKSYPVMILGAGNGNNNNTYGYGTERAKIYKDGKKFAIEYDSPNRKGAYPLDKQSRYKYMTKFYFNESDTDDEGQAVYFESQGGIRFHSDNKFVAKTSNTQYLSIIKDNFLKLQFGTETFIEVTDGRIRLRVNKNNHLTVTNNGILINGIHLDIDKLNQLNNL